MTQFFGEYFDIIVIVAMTIFMLVLSGVSIDDALRGGRP